MVNHILTVRGRKASVTPRTLVQGTVGQDTLTLDLDSEWNGLNVTVTFVAATTEVTPVLNANTCEIPHEVLVDSGEIDVFVLGTRDGKAMRHASLAHKMVVKKSNMSDGSTTADPSISAYRQAYDDAVKATEAANSAAGTAGSTAAEMAALNKRYAAQIEQQASDFSTAQTQRANDFSTAQTQRAHDFDSAMQGYENAFNEAEGERASAETERVKVEKERVKAEEKRSQDSKTRLEELAQAKTNAETATGEANTARDEAKKAATDATSAAGRATDAAGLAETAKTNANTAAEEANAAATKAEAAARKADGAAETAGTAASTAAVAANKADTAAGNAEIMAEKADASANKADIAAGKANEATVAATNAATKANEVEAKLTGNILKGNVKDTFVHVDDAFPSSLLGIEIEGATEQVTTTGKNLINGCDSFFREADSASKSYLWGYTLGSNPLVLDKPLEAGTYTFSIYSTKGCSIYFSKKPYVTGQFVNFSCNKVVSGDTRFGLNRYYGTFTLDDTYELVGLYSENYNTCFGGMIEKGSTVSAYEPYTGGKPSPSPEYPQEIKVVENPVVKVAGRNLLHYTDYAGGYNLQVGKKLDTQRTVSPLVFNGEDAYAEATSHDWECNHIFATEPLPAGTYYVSFKLWSDTGAGAFSMYITSSDYVIINVLKNMQASGSGYTQSSPCSIVNSAFTVADGERFAIAVNVNGLRGGGVLHVTGATVCATQPTAYAPYAGTTIPFTLPTEHHYLAKLPDGTADEIVVDREGNVELVARVQKVDVSNLKSPSSVEVLNSGLTRFSYWNVLNVPVKQDSTAIAPILKNVIDYNFKTKGFYVSGLSIFAGSLTDPTEAFKASGYIYTILATPITYQLGKINLPVLPESTSNVWTDAEVTPRTGIKYTRDVNIVVANLESAIASITQG